MFMSIDLIGLDTLYSKSTQLSLDNKIVESGNNHRKGPEIRITINKISTLRSLKKAIS